MISVRYWFSQEPSALLCHASLTLSCLTGDSGRRVRALATTTAAASSTKPLLGLSAMQATLPSREAVSPDLRKYSLTPTRAFYTPGAATNGQPKPWKWSKWRVVPQLQRRRQV